ncbi:hypothetical protein LKACC16343_00688 [Companilactobacillus bobalius]|uniref:Uncharacterized protein n=1 Tax=Companilactobacillus bobalius TaxID=2801451 RepID=A0A202FDM9_9LACO|nr:hypothetical protein LKACC16343_00688 [Companilactobacillus bobalius]
MTVLKDLSNFGGKINQNTNPVTQIELLDFLVYSDKRLINSK